MRQDFAKPGTVVSVLSETEFAACQRKFSLVRSHTGKSLTHSNAFR